ncbi:MAG: hypothetical protein IAE96_03040 [Chitinophagaceae bacterium]|nr:hypothetical protein [Chitinophagaceae bacterium]
MKRITSLVLTGLLLSSCHKGAEEKDRLPPVVSLSAPLENQVFSAGQTIRVQGTVTDDKFIAEIHLHVSNAQTGGLLIDVHEYPAAASTNLDLPFTAVAGTSYKVQVIAKDRGANESRATLNISCN